MAKNVVEVTLYKDGTSGEEMPLTINGENVIGNAGPLKYIANLEQALHMLKPDVRLDAAYPEWVASKENSAQVENGIVWSINKMLPVNLGGKPQSNPDSGTREVKPRLRTDIMLDDGTALQMYGQRFSVYFQFDIFAKSPKEAEDLADWFQFGFMDHFGGLFGSLYTVFRQRMKDKEVEKLNQTLSVRSLEYIVDIEKHTAVPESLIDIITFKITNNDEEDQASN
ncbi:hypothetical protein H8D85_02600 [bacterium]|nr:hypothetical protein [bacterium]